jgi:hypothetical protein
LYENDAGAAELDPRRSSAPPGDEVCADAPWIRRTLAALINRFDLLELDWTPPGRGAHCSGWEAGGPRTERVVRRPASSVAPSLVGASVCVSSALLPIFFDLSHLSLPAANPRAGAREQLAPLLDAISFRHLHIPTSSRARKGEVGLRRLRRARKSSFALGVS